MNSESTLPLTLYDEPDFSNQYLPMKKSPFTAVRSYFKDDNGNLQYEYWMKLLKSVADAEWIASFPFGLVFGNESMHTPVVKDEVGYFFTCNGVYDCKYGHYPKRPSNRPDIITLESERRVFSNTFIEYDGKKTNFGYYEYLNDNCKCWTYLGSTVGDDDENSFVDSDGNCELYGYVYPHSYNVNGGYDSVDRCMMCVTNSLYDKDGLKSFISSKGGISLDTSFYDFLFARKVLTIRDFEIIANDTLEQNTYYVAIEDKNCNFLDFKTTTTFGVRIGDVIGEYASKFSDDVLEKRVVDDMFIRMK